MTSYDPRSWAEDAAEAARAGAEAFFGGPGKQAREDGIRSALEATQRLTEMFTRGFPLGGEGWDGGQIDEEAYRRFRAETERMFDAWMDVVRSSFVTFMSVADRAFLSGADERRGQRDAVRLSPIVAGESTASTLWIRNPTDSPLVGLHLRSTSLVSDSGDVITADQITLSPDEIDLIEPQSSYAVSVRMETREHSLAGVYRGAITADGVPDAPVVAEIVPKSG